MTEQQLIEEYYCLLFLADKDALDSFVGNFRNDFYEGGKGDDNLIMNCMNWLSTLDGEDFWNDLYEEFDSLPRDTMPEEYICYVSDYALDNIRRKDAGVVNLFEFKDARYKYKVTIRIEE